MINFKSAFTYILFLIALSSLVFSERKYNRDDYRPEGGKMLDSENRNIDYTEIIKSGAGVRIAAGTVPGYSSINKFGHNGDVDTGTDPEDVWAGGGIYSFYPDTAVNMVLRSSSANDDSGNTGAWDVIAFGLDSAWHPIQETLILNGTANVPLIKQYIRMYRTIVVQGGSAGSNVGNIVITSADTADTAIFIEAGDSQTQQAIYTISAGKTGFFVKGYVAISNNNPSVAVAAQFKWLARLNNGIQGIFATKGQVSVQNSGSGAWQYQYGVPVALPEKTDIVIRCEEVTANNTAVVGGFDLILVDD